MQTAGQLPEMAELCGFGFGSRFYGLAWSHRGRWLTILQAVIGE